MIDQEAIVPDRSKYIVSTSEDGADGYFDKQVAVKVVHRGGLLGDELAQRFRLEARVLAWTLQVLPVSSPRM